MFIDSANSVITNENNGLKIPAIMGTATLKNGDSIVSQWKAPVSLGNVACTLKPGTYTIVPSFLGYTSYERETLQTYTITIVKK
jgi:hypothetical protein